MPAAPLRAAEEWKPVSSAELQLKTPKIDANADAEALFWDVRVEDEVDVGGAVAVLKHYLRVKVFTERGRESQGNVDITWPKGTKISDIAARTIRPNGDILEVSRDAIFERTVVKSGGLKFKAKSFALPGIVPGAIVEYRWKETRSNQLTEYVKLHFQRDVPVHEVTYHIKPFRNPAFPYDMRANAFGMAFPQFVKEKEGFTAVTVRDVPAWVEEPRMPPEDQIRRWMLVYYTPNKKLDVQEFWKDYGRGLWEGFKPYIKPNGDVKKAAQTAVGDAATDDDKVKRIFEYVRANVKNLSNESCGVSREERDKAKDNKNPGDTLKRGMGTGFDVNMLFASMVNAAGMDARVIRIAGRSNIFFDRRFADGYFLNSLLIAVKSGEGWKFHDPASSYTPYGMLYWSDEAVDALIPDPKEPVFVRTPLSPAAASIIRREATLRLTDDGTLEGDVRAVYTGHTGTTRKWQEEEDTAAEREESISKSVKGRLTNAEVTNVRVQHVTSLDKPYEVAYHVKVPGYATRTGKRLFLQPAYFQMNTTAEFPSSERRQDVYFRYPWTEADEVRIELPEGYSLDLAEAPQSIGLGDAGQYLVELKVSGDRRTLLYRRRLTFGDNGMILYPVRSYAQLKRAFDAIHERDGHTVALRQAPPVAAGGQ